MMIINSTIDLTEKLEKEEEYESPKLQALLADSAYTGAEKLGICALYIKKMTQQIV